MGSSGRAAALSPSWRQSLANRLLAWFNQAARDLPWRRTRDLYAIWISEVMLQQTQVATVVPYWERFLARFPDPTSLAAADEREVLRQWEGLGYYRRARQLHAAANKIVCEHDGVFPATYDAVRALPGIGRYTAGAILSIGLDQKLPILEANTIRVLSRLSGYTKDVQSTAGREYLWSVAEKVLPNSQCGFFNQALMELGSEICTPKAPACGGCPVAQLCRACQLNLVDKIPRPAKRMNFEELTELAVIVRDGPKVLLRHCQPGERWAGLWDFPRFAVANGQMNGQLKRSIIAGARQLTGLEIEPGDHLITIKHGVTRFRITLHCYAAQPKRGGENRGKRAPKTRWVAIDSLADYPLSTTGRKISGLLTA
ncbi:MAG TPA: A/G-specific adenine glycosylase [Pirellulaceae bacterium]|jgi:A/G-specific adenine glycosylase